MGHKDPFKPKVKKLKHYECLISVCGKRFATSSHDMLYEHLREEHPNEKRETALFFELVMDVDSRADVTADDEDLKIVKFKA